MKQHKKEGKNKQTKERRSTESMVVEGVTGGKDVLYSYVLKAPKSSTWRSCTPLFRNPLGASGVIFWKVSVSRGTTSRQGRETIHGCGCANVDDFQPSKAVLIVRCDDMRDMVKSDGM
jgi:hypothetical protein